MEKQNTYSETEEKIFRAALREFGRYGKKGARMQNIADEAGCNKALVHYYFRNKERLFEEISEYVFTDLFSAIHDAITDAPTFKETLEAFVGTYIEYLQKYSVYPLLMYRGMELDELKKRHKKIVEQFGAAPSSLFIEKINAAIENDEIRAVDPHHTFMSIMGSCIYLFVAHPVLSLSNDDIDIASDAFVEARKEHIVNLIYNGLNKPND